MSRSIRVLLVIQYSLVWLGLRVALEQTEGIHIVGEVGTVEDALRCIETDNPDVIVLDCQLLERQAVDIARAVVRADGPPYLLALSTTDDLTLPL
jgi:DNA-binding NarL/FixJ family response regulator